MTVYSIKRMIGDQGFEVSGPDKDWVEAKAEAYEQGFTASKLGAKKSPKTRTSTSSRPVTTRTNTTSKPSESTVRQKLDTAMIGQLVDYVGARQEAFDKKAPNQAIIIAKFLKDSLAIELIDKHDLDYIYKQVGLWELVNHGDQLENAVKRGSYFTRESGKYKLNYAGEKFAQDTARDQEKA